MVKTETTLYTVTDNQFFSDERSDAKKKKVGSIISSTHNKTLFLFLFCIFFFVEDLIALGSK